MVPLGVIESGILHLCDFGRVQHLAVLLKDVAGLDVFWHWNRTSSPSKSSPLNLHDLQANTQRWADSKIVPAVTAALGFVSNACLKTPWQEQCSMLARLSKSSSSSRRYRPSSSATTCEKRFSCTLLPLPHEAGLPHCPCRCRPWIGAPSWLSPHLEANMWSVVSKFLKTSAWAGVECQGRLAKWGWCGDAWLNFTHYLYMPFANNDRKLSWLCWWRATGEWMRKIIQAAWSLEGLLQSTNLWQWLCWWVALAKYLTNLQNFAEAAWEVRPPARPTYQNGKPLWCMRPLVAAFFWWGLSQIHPSRIPWHKTGVDTAWEVGQYPTPSQGRIPGMCHSPSERARHPLACSLRSNLSASH